MMTSWPKKQIWPLKLFYFLRSSIQFLKLYTSLYGLWTQTKFWLFPPFAQVIIQMHQIKERSTNANASWFFGWFARKIECTVWVGMIFLHPCTYRCFGGISRKVSPSQISSWSSSSCEFSGSRGESFECFVLGGRDFNIRKPYPKKTSRSKSCQCPNHFFQMASSSTFVLTVTQTNSNHTLAATLWHLPMANCHIPGNSYIPPRETEHHLANLATGGGRHGTLWVRNMVSHPPQFEQPKNFVALFM